MFIKFNYTPKQIIKIKKNIISKFNIFVKNLHEKDYENNNELLNDYLYSLSEFDYIYDIIIFLQAVSPNKKIQNASIKFQTDLATYFSKFLSNKDNYNKMLRLKEIKNKSVILKRLIERVLKGFELSGVNLDNNKRKEYEIKSIELLKYENEFNQNIYNSNKKIELFDYEVDGIPENFLQKIKSKNKYIVGTSYPEQDIMMKHCSNQLTRRKYYKMINNIGHPKNMIILQKILKIRYHIAKLLGYSNNIKYKLSYNRIVKSESEINNLIKSLIPNLIKSATKDFSKLRDIASKENSQEITISDIAYYSHKYLEKNYKIDTEKIKKHFPLKYVISRIFKLFERIFSIKIRRSFSYTTWHPSVMSYSIYDGDEFLGLIFLDLFPRANKYNHAATFDLQKSYINMLGDRIIPVTAVVCNFDRKYMSHKELTTFCHEMGHAFHNIFSKVKYAEFAGTNTEIDFVETISQFFENWAWTPKFLRYVSKPILSESNINKIIELKNYNIAFHYLNQILYIKYDLEVHKRENIKLNEIHDIWYNIYNQLMPFVEINNKFNINFIKELYPMCSFGHLIGYDVAYYSYLWSVIYSYDILSKFEKYGLFNPKIGKELREKIMSRGGTVKGTELLKDFLGREPNEKYFMKKIFN